MGLSSPRRTRVAALFSQPADRRKPPSLQALGPTPLASFARCYPVIGGMICCAPPHVFYPACSQSFHLCNALRVSCFTCAKIRVGQAAALGWQGLRVNARQERFSRSCVIRVTVTVASFGLPWRSCLCCRAQGLFQTICRNGLPLTKPCLAAAVYWRRP